LAGEVVTHITPSVAYPSSCSEVGRRAGGREEAGSEVRGQRTEKREKPGNEKREARTSGKGTRGSKKK
jgi:hypothetical protein